jgi:dTDP-4-amino-4,6-dideoxygalactose transaminase
MNKLSKILQIWNHNSQWINNMLWRIPLADVDFGNEEYQAVDKVLKSKWLTMGTITMQFETEFSAFTGIEYAIAVTNCTAGLHLSMAALGISCGDEVIVPSLSFVATANAVCYTGAKPIFADIVSAEDLTISPESIRSLITPHTKAIIVMHYGGYVCDMDQILAIARENNLFVIEDAAHASGAYLNEVSLGGIGDVGCFSFFPNKNMTTAEGGIITTKNNELAQKIRLLRSHGMTSLTWDRHKGHAWSYDVIDLGYNYRIDEIRSALGITQLKKLSKNNQKRRLLTKHYCQSLKQLVPDVGVPFTNHRGESANHLMPIILPKGIVRTEIMERMKNLGIQTSIHYPPIHLFTYYKQRHPNCLLEKTEDIANRELTLPLYPGMSEADVDYVVTGIRDSFK